MSQGVKLLYWSRYAKYFVDELGTNDFGLNPPDTRLGEVQADVQAIWQTAYANGVLKVFRTLLGPRTGSTNNWSTPEHQTPRAGWGANGIVAPFNNWIVDDPNGLQEAVPFTSWLSPENPFVWVTKCDLDPDPNCVPVANYFTPDGLHPNVRGTISLSEELRAVMDANP